MESLLTIPELAELIKLSTQTIRRYVLRKEIPYLKIRKVVRFRGSDIEQWINSGGLKTEFAPSEEREGDLFTALDEAGSAGGHEGEEA